MLQKNQYEGQKIYEISMKQIQEIPDAMEKGPNIIRRNR